MLLDCALCGLVVLATVGGLFLGTRRDLGIVLGFGLGYALTPWVLAPLTALTLRITVNPAFASMLAGLACLLVPGALMGALTAAALQRVPLQLQRTLPLGVEGLLGALLWGSGMTLSLIALLGALATQEPSAYALSGAWHLPLKSSRLYVTTELHGLLPPPHAQTVIENHALPLVARRKLRIQADLSDPRVRAALGDPLVRRAIESGDPSELQARNRVLRPLNERPPANRQQPEASGGTGFSLTGED